MSESEKEEEPDDEDIDEKSLPDYGNMTESDLEDDEWINTAVRDIGYYLRSHKFNDFDRRYYFTFAETRKGFFDYFPVPPLRSLHWEVRKNCEEGFHSCITYLHEKVLLAEIRRQDDVTTIIRERGLKNATVVKQHNLECLRLFHLDYIGGVPFMGPLERFQWRTSASYYMCWFTLRKQKELLVFGEPCDNFASCLDQTLGARNGDPRASDAQPYGCATYSFCPDPCCPLRHVKNLTECWDSTSNPCYADADPRNRTCAWNPEHNTDFVELVLNHWNVSCNCSRRGFQWVSRYGVCVDVDECVAGDYDCDETTEACYNLPGSYKCACRWGYLYEESVKGCVYSSFIGESYFLEEEEEEEEAKWWVELLERANQTVMHFYEEVKIYFVQPGGQEGHLPSDLCVVTSILFILCFIS